MVTNDTYEIAAQYQLFAYQQGSEPPSTSLWKKVSLIDLICDQIDFLFIFPLFFIKLYYFYIILVTNLQFYKWLVFVSLKHQFSDRLYHVYPKIFLLLP